MYDLYYCFYYQDKAQNAIFAKGTDIYIKLKMGQKMQHSDKPSMGNVKHSPKDKFVLNDVSKEELEKRRIPIYSYLL